MAIDVAAYETALAESRIQMLLKMREMTAAELEARGGDRESILRDLEAVRQQFLEAGNEYAEDLVLDVMDFVTGWCSPRMRV